MMHIPVITREKGLTGNRRYRVGFFNRVILQVEIQKENDNFLLPSGHPRRKVSFTIWRDAKPHEIGIPERVSPAMFFHIKDDIILEMITRK